MPSNWRQSFRWAFSKAVGRRQARTCRGQRGFLAQIRSQARHCATNDDGLRLSVEFTSMGEWSDISKRLGQVPGVENIDVVGMSGRSARITLRYPDGIQRLADVAPQHGLSMRQNAGGWVLSGGR
jgi:hypothetical protein